MSTRKKKLKKKAAVFGAAEGGRRTRRLRDAHLPTKVARPRPGWGVRRPGFVGCSLEKNKNSLGEKWIRKTKKKKQSNKWDPALKIPTVHKGP